jgi:hypothetical protein
LLEALYQTNLSPYEWRTVLFIIRKTYGFHHKDAEIALSQFVGRVKEKETGEIKVQGTGLDMRHIGRTLDKLVDRRIIGRKKVGGKWRYWFQKEYKLSKHSKRAKTPLPSKAEVRLKSMPPEAVQSMPPEAYRKDIKYKKNTIYGNEDTKREPLAPPPTGVSSVKETEEELSILDLITEEIKRVDGMTPEQVERKRAKMFARQFKAGAQVKDNPVEPYTTLYR